MTCVLMNFMLLLFMLTAIVQNGYFVEGVGYQASATSSKGVDKGDANSPANYKFEYGVNDRSQFGHEEERNGHQTRGQYRVLLPDGRLQVVTYRADENGYTADVTYENGATSSSGGYSSNGGNNAGGGYAAAENSATAASTYGPPPPKPSTREYSGSDGNGAFGKRNSRSFVKLRRTVNGRTFNYAY